MASPILQFKRGAFADLPGLRAGEPALTTDTFDFYVGIDSTTNNNKFFGSHRYWRKENGTTSLRLRLVDKNGTNSINLKSPDTLSGITTYTLPEVITAGYYLRTNALGDLEWSNQFPSIGVTAITAGIATFTDPTDNTLGNPDTGGVQIDGGLGVNKNITVGGNLNVQGYSEFIGVVTFRGGTISLGDSNTDDIVVAGEFKSNLIPTDDATYDLGSGGKRWRQINVSGAATVGSFVCNDGSTFTGSVQIDNNLNVNGNITLGGTSIYHASERVIVRDRDIILGVTTDISLYTDTSTDTTANHGGIAIASTEGTPLVSLRAAGINTLPDTYKQLMWVKSGTWSGLSTDAWMFNYGVGIGSTQIPDGVRLAVGHVHVTNTAVSCQHLFVTTSAQIAFADIFGGSINNTPIGQTNPVQASFTQLSYNNSLSSGISTFSNLVDANGGLDVIGGTTLDRLNVTGVSTFTGAIDANGGLDVSGGETILSSATVSDLTSGRVVLAGTSGSLQDSANLTFGSDGLKVGANGINVIGVSTFSSGVDFGGDIKLNTNNIKASDGNVNITLTSNTLTTFAGDIKVTGNNIQSSNGTVAIGLSNSDVTISGDLTVGGNDIKSSNGTTSLTLSSTGAVTATNDFTINGNLYVSGSTTQVNTAALTVEDRTIDLGVVNGAAPSSSTTWDLGILFNYNSSGAKKSAVIWEHGDTRFKFASVIGSDTDGSDANTPQLSVTTFAPIEIAELWVNNSCTGGAQQVIGCVNSELQLQNIVLDAGTF